MRTGSALGVLALAGALGLAGCVGGRSAGDDDPRPTVVATTTQVADFVRSIGGDRIVVTQLVRPNVDPHDYEPAPADVRAVGMADLVVENGLGLDTWLDDTIANSGFAGPVVDASEGARTRTVDGQTDPHLWHDPTNARIMCQNIVDGLARVDPDDAEAFGANFDRYAAQLTELDRDNRAAVDTIPADQRLVVTNHDSLGYYLDRYGLTFVGSIIPSADTSAELSPADVDEIVARIRDTGTRAVFAESSLSARTAETIGDEAGVRVVAGEDALYGDSLGPKGSSGATYLDSERHNTQVIVSALTGG